MVFIGRRTELNILEERYASNRFEFCVMYGRRRVGKTTLINRFATGKPTVFFAALQASAQENLDFLSAAIMEILPNGIVGATFSSFSDALKAVFDLAEERRLVLVIDEYPYLAESYPAISSVLQHLIDQRKGSSRLYLILNGSSMAQMTDEFFTSNRPLYGRKTFQIKLRPFGFFDLREYFSHTNPSLLPQIYAAYGGIPKYFEHYHEKQGFKQNIITDFLTIGSPLLEEPEAVLKKELREPAAYNTIFTAIVQGSHRYSELSSKAKLESGNITRYLETLVFLDLIRKEVPSFTGEQKKTLYRVEDNMFRFWFRFVGRSLSLINSNRPEIAFKLVEDGMGQFMGEAFEKICLEYLWLANGSDRLPFSFTEAGRWWGGNPKTKAEAEFDILAHDGKACALFCECKWSDRQVGEDILAQLSEKALLPQFSELPSKHIALFSKSGFTKGCQQAAAAKGNVSLVSLDEMLS